MRQKVETACVNAPFLKGTWQHQNFKTDPKAESSKMFAFGSVLMFCNINIFGGLLVHFNNKNWLEIKNQQPYQAKSVSISDTLQGPSLKRITENRISHLL